MFCLGFIPCSNLNEYNSDLRNYNGKAMKTQSLVFYVIKTAENKGIQSFGYLSDLANASINNFITLLMWKTIEERKNVDLTCLTFITVLCHKIVKHSSLSHWLINIISTSKEQYTCITYSTACLKNEKRHQKISLGNTIKSGAIINSLNSQPFIFLQVCTCFSFVFFLV